MASLAFRSRRAQRRPGSAKEARPTPHLVRWRRVAARPKARRVKARNAVARCHRYGADSLGVQQLERAYRPALAIARKCGRHSCFVGLESCAAGMALAILKALFLKPSVPLDLKVCIIQKGRLDRPRVGRDFLPGWARGTVKCGGFCTREGVRMRPGGAQACEGTAGGGYRRRGLRCTRGSAGRRGSFSGAWAAPRPRGQR